ncbi:MAG TPA: protein-export chaperone SecB [Arenicellales bacterium]|nr:protein-export chaperone SecB [Arenicellales bacterium]
MAETQTQKFELRKVYVKDMSFESPMAPDIFRQTEASPRIEVQLDVSHDSLGDGLYESVLTVTVNGRLEDRHAFLAEVQQAGVYELSGLDPERGLVAALEVACPNMLFPFAREAINELVVRGGFPQLLLAPVNFETLYRRKAQRASSGEQGGNASGSAEQEGGQAAT